MKLTGIGMFSFPITDPPLMKKWETAFKFIRRKGDAKNKKDSFDPTKDSTVVCEFHFPAENIQRALGSSRKKLRKGSVPSIFPQKKKIGCFF